MKKFILIALCFMSVNAIAQQRNCAEDASTTPVCDLQTLEIQTELHRKNIFDFSKGNEPEKAQESIQKLQSVFSTMLSCRSDLNCRDLANKKKSPIGMGWIESSEISTWKSMDAQGKQLCNVSAEVFLQSGNARVRGIISGRDGKILYELPEVNCAPENLEVRRQTRLTEHGVLMVDFSMEVKQFPGKWLYSSTKRTPQFKVGQAGNLEFTMADGAKFVVEKDSGKIIESDFLDPVMFDSSVCKTDFRTENGKTRTYTDIRYRSGAQQRYVYKTMLDFGGTSQEVKHKKIISSLPRRPLE
ncbi:MAG: hypothetical protein EP319_18145 [Deltaproteobacteria bacterium]|nr:MAG: hypothetical protein EP319_18145 [Deltaproteobacteria bacterium]